MNPCGGAQWPWPPGPNRSLLRAAYRKCLCRKRLPTIFSTTRFGYAAAERAIERPGPHCNPVAGRNRNITAGGRCVELGMNSRYRGVNTHRPVVNSWVGRAVTPA
jgi:hypothetical protein